MRRFIVKRAIRQRVTFSPKSRGGQIIKWETVESFALPSFAQAKAEELNRANASTYRVFHCGKQYWGGA